MELWLIDAAGVLPIRQTEKPMTVTDKTADIQENKQRVKK